MLCNAEPLSKLCAPVLRIVEAVLCSQSSLRTHSLLSRLQSCVLPSPQIIEVILNAPFHATKAALPAMIDAGWGRVVNTGARAWEGPQLAWLPLGCECVRWCDPSGLRVG